MAKYKLLERAFIHQRLWEPDEIVEVADDLMPGPHMVPQDSAARAAVKKYGVIVGEAAQHSLVDSIASFGAAPPIKHGMASSE
jgi:glutathione S-transferase